MESVANGKSEIPIEGKLAFESTPLAMRRKCLGIIRQKENVDTSTMLPNEIQVGVFSWNYVLEHHLKRNKANKKNVRNQKKVRTNTTTTSQ